MASGHRLNGWMPKIITLALVAILAAGGWIYWQWYATYHFAEVQAGVLYRDGNRSMREFATTCRKANIRTVVMLNDAQEVQKDPFKSEIAFCQSEGIRLVHIPVLVGHRPGTEDVQKFLQVMGESKNHPVLVHCAQGVRRTAMMVAAYQQSILGYDREKAKAAILPWGRKPERLNDIRGFIDDYDPQSRTVGSAHVIMSPQDPD